MKIKIHSIVDLITNSSTEIFISSHKNTKKELLALVDEILKASGSDKKAEDLFDVKITTQYTDYDKDDAKEEAVEVVFDSNGKRTDVAAKEEDDYDEYGENHTVELVPKNASKATLDITQSIKNALTIEKKEC